MGSTPGGVYSWDQKVHRRSKNYGNRGYKEYNELVKDDRFKEVIEELNH